MLEQTLLIHTVSPYPNPLPAGEREQELVSPLPGRERGRGEGGKLESERRTKQHRIRPRLLAVAKTLRRQLTPQEQTLWYRLRDRRLGGHKFRRQVAMQGYVLDFYCAESRLVVELDGGQHNEDAHALKDRQRDAVLGERGIKVLRFWNDQVVNELDAVLTKIAAVCEGSDG